MDRRAFLVTAAGVAAGCGQGGESAGTSPTDAQGGQPTEPTSSATTATPTPTRTDTPTPRSASLAVTDLAVPSTVEIGVPVRLTATVENDGGEAGTYTVPVEARFGTGDWTTTDVEVSTSVPAGEAVTETVELPAHQYVEPAAFRLADADPVARTRFLARERRIGEAHVLPNGIALSLAAVRFADAYTYRGPDGEETLDPTEGERWVVGTVRAENVGDEPAAAPLVSDLAFFRGEEEYAYQHVSGNRDRYEGGELAPGEASEGDLPSDVPRDATRADLRLEHSDEYDGGRVTVYWSLDE